MTFSTHPTKIGAACLAGVLVFGLAACSGEDDSTDSTATTAASPAAVESTAAAGSTSATASVPMPTPDELNDVLALATDSSAPLEERILTVQGGEKAPDLFDVMAQSKQESGANFVVVPPVLKGYSPTSVLTVVKATLPDREPQTATDVEFVFEDGHWKLAQSWACTLVSNAGLDPSQIPDMCSNDPAAPPVNTAAPDPAAGQPEGQPQQPVDPAAVPADQQPAAPQN
ncbi:hypothetical protein ACFSSC_05615 [Corynebacterium mendelii]|uniref:hypothetical protein n=1 Tax=Corynebacterium mendelii TaxID=2765362 RepID=UPI002ED366AC